MYLARPFSKTGGWGFESLHSCQKIKGLQERSAGCALKG
jgi:hypothetical protein